MTFVTILIPARNEENFIAACLNSVVHSHYPAAGMEILVLDGMSTDKTRDIVGEFILRYPNIRLIENPAKTFPGAVNLGIKESKGEIIIILGAHAVYDNHYIPRCVSHLLNSDVDNVGGVLETIGKNESFIGKAITLVLTNPFGVGNATFRTGSNKIMEVDTVFGGCYRRSIFDKIGLFDERLVSSSDIDFNKRLRNAGGKILLDPEINATYYTRSTFRNFMRNNVRNGFWVIYPLKFVKHIPVSMRHFTPLLFLVGLTGSLAISLLFPVLSWLFPAILVIYFLTGFYFSLKSASHGFSYFLVLPFLFFLLHLSYGIGSFWGGVNVLIKK
jgi:glycosyltransferase involved in cell wall biosynthesis